MAEMTSLLFKLLLLQLQLTILCTFFLLRFIILQSFTPLQSFIPRFIILQSTIHRCIILLCLHRLGHLLLLQHSLLLKQKPPRRRGKGSEHVVLLL